MKAWYDFLESQKNELGKDAVNRWIAPLKVVRFDARNLYIEAKDHFQALWFEEHIRPKAEKVLKNNNSSPIRIHLSITNHTPPTKKKSPQKKQLSSSGHAFSPVFDRLNHTCTFESLIKTKDNEMTDHILINSTQRISSEQPPLYNPIYISGPQGSGKTHRLMAFAHTLSEEGKHAIYVRAETFAEHVVSAIRSGEMSTFRNYYRTADALIVDDIHLLSGKKATQEEFFHTFNALYLSGKQILISDRDSSSELQNIEARLTSRFSWGIAPNIVALQPAELPQLLKQHCDLHQFPLNQQVISFLCEQFSSNTFALMRALEALILRTHQSKNKELSSTLLTPNMVRASLEDLLSKEKEIALNSDKLLHLITDHFAISQSELLSSSQKQEILMARQFAVYLIRKKLSLPYAKIGSILNRDHTTILSSFRRMEKGFLKPDETLSLHLKQLERKISQSSHC